LAFAYIITHASSSIYSSSRIHFVTYASAVRLPCNVVSRGNCSGLF
jgi:hypothetical protein